MTPIVGVYQTSVHLFNCLTQRPIGHRALLGPLIKVSGFKNTHLLAGPLVTVVIVTITIDVNFRGWRTLIPAASPALS